MKMPSVLKCVLWIALICILKAPRVFGDTYRLVKPINPELTNALHACDVGCLTIIDVGTTYGSEMYEVEGVVIAPSCKNKCFKYNIPVKDGQMTPLVSKLSFKDFDCKVFGNEAMVVVPWNTRKLPPSYIYSSEMQNPEFNKSRQATTAAQLNNIPNDNAKNEVPGIVLRLDCLKNDGSIVNHSIVYGQFETADGKINKKRSNSATRVLYPGVVNVISIFLVLHLLAATL